MIGRPLPGKTKMVIYADDILLLMEETNIDRLITAANLSVEILARKIKHLSLKLAPQKTEAVIFIRTKNIKNCSINVCRQEIKIGNKIKYLGLILDHSMTFVPHLQYVISRAKNMLKSMHAIMRNTRGPSELKRKTYVNVVNSIILLAAPVWAGEINNNKKRNLANHIHRLESLRVIE